MAAEGRDWAITARVLALARQVTTSAGSRASPSRHDTMSTAAATSPSASSSRLQRASSPLSPYPHAQAQNPISLRLYKVLGATFDDDATREALDTLAELYAPASPSQSSGTRGKEVKRDGELDDDGDEEYYERPTGLVAPAGLEEGVAGDIAAKARKNLRRDVESKLAESSRQFLKAFGEVDKVR